MARKKGSAIDLHLLHQKLWHGRKRNGEMSIRSTDLAKELDIAPQSMSRILTWMVEQKRLRRIGNHIYVNDPDIWAWENKVQKFQQPDSSS